MSMHAQATSHMFNFGYSSRFKRRSARGTSIDLEKQVFAFLNVLRFSLG